MVEKSLGTGVHLARGGHIEGHDFEGSRFVIQGLDHILVWFLNKCAQSRFVEHFSVLSGPSGGHWGGLSLHGGFESLVGNASSEFVREVGSQSLVNNSDVSESESYVEVFVIFNQVLDGEEDSS